MHAIVRLFYCCCAGCGRRRRLEPVTVAGGALSAPFLSGACLPISHETRQAARRFAGVWLIGLLFLYPALADELEQRRSELDELQTRIQAVEQLIQRIESERQAEAAELARAERAVSAASRQLREVEQQLEAALMRVAEHEQAAGLVAARIEEHTAELAAWLRRQYMHGGHDMSTVFVGRNPNQIARDLRYIESLSTARAELVASLRRDHAEYAALLERANQERDQLVELRSTQQARQNSLEQSRRARAEVLAKTTASLRTQQQQAEAMRRSEAQLGDVVTALAQAAEARERARRLAEERERAVQAAQQAAPVAPPSRVELQARVAPVRQAARPAAQVATPARQTPGRPFPELRGRLGLPVSGELIGRFGTPRASTGTRWRGTFIRAAEGAQVQAVAAGQVVFSDWLRGYGNLIIVDHGQDYLSIYGNNDALLLDVGARVEAGSPIATVGSAGWIQDSGLYFEIRHRGEPLDPAQWIARR